MKLCNLQCLQSCKDGAGDSPMHHKDAVIYTHNIHVSICQYSPLEIQNVFSTEHMIKSCLLLFTGLYKPSHEFEALAV